MLITGSKPIRGFCVTSYPFLIQNLIGVLLCLKLHYDINDKREMIAYQSTLENRDD